MRPVGLAQGRWLAAFLLGAAFGLAVPVCVAGPAAAQGEEATNGRSPVEWLRAIRTAAQHANYTGTIVYQRGDEVHSSHIVHFFDGVSPRERVLTLDGRPREFIRQGDEVQCLYPKLHRVVIEQAGPRTAFPALGQVGLSRVLDHYSLTAGELERVAGIECRVLHLAPRDAFRYGYKLWVEPDSGLLLKIQVLDGDEAMVEQIAFSDVRIGGAADLAELKPSWSTAGWEVVRHPSRKIDLSRQGWSITTPDGFRMLTEVERNLGDDSTQAALQAVYSDGLATVSVFIEPGAALDDPAPLLHHGPSSAFMRRVGDARVTVVGEVPPTTARSIADSVRFVSGH